MTLKNSFALAFSTVKSNKLRTGITVAIIAFGIMALIGIITAIEAMNQSITESFSSMGANAFTIKFKESRVRFGGNNDDATVSKRGLIQKKSNLNKPIKKDDAEFFKQNFKFPAKVSIYLRGARSIECIYENKKTNPVCAVWGGDENYLEVNGYKIVNGRNLNNIDIESGRNVCIIGSNIAAKLFPDNADQCIDQVIRVSGMPYRVIGLLKSKGSSMGRVDDIIFTSYNNARKFNDAASSFLIGVMVTNVIDLNIATGEASSVFRAVRKLQPKDAENFVIEKSDKFAEMFIGFLSGISGAAAVIGLITLLGAAIGLMNIMLVAVNERTREVGLIKALGGTKKDIKQQFLFESMIISVMGAVVGIFLGILIGNTAALLLKTGVVIPWLWVIGGIVICSAVGLLAGVYPASKAAKLNPIVALRHE
ncbi:MAG: ABC transporter permease [Chitinophagaceae bacterium]|nr:ABC transporter permease [Chitinophagaceae bacterium]